MSGNKKITNKELKEILRFESNEERKIFAIEMFQLNLMALIEEKMRRKDLTKKALAGTLKISPSYLTQFFAADKILNLKMLIKLTKIFKINMNLIKYCPVCNSKNIEKHIIKKIFKEYLNFKKEINIVEYKCKDCESEGDFFNENEKNIENTLKQLKSDVFDFIVEDLNSQGIRLIDIERICGLHIGSIIENKNSKYSSYALLKIIHQNPKILKEAEKN